LLLASGSFEQKESMKRLWAALLALALTGCGDWLSGRMAVRPWQETRELVALVPNGPTTLFVNAAGMYAGLEYDLVNQFAAHHDLKVRFVVTSSRAEALEKIRRGEGHLAVGVFSEEASDLLFGPIYQTVEPVLVSLPERLGEQGLHDLAQGRLMLSTLPEYQRVVVKMKTRYAGMNYELSDRSDAETLFEQVARGEIPLALVDAYTADVMQNYYPRVQIQRSAGEVIPLAWALGDADEQFVEMVDSFFRQVSEQGIMVRLADRYYGHINRVESLNALRFLERRTSVLPRYRAWFQEAERETGIDWRLLAALAYQESHWDPDVVSFTGVRGIMMLTSDTARGLGVEDREDPYQSIMGGARLLRKLIDMVPERIAEPDRTWLALAAYNVGMGHLQDAQTLAKRAKKNPDSWIDVKYTLVLLRNPEYFMTVKHGYARGGEPVIFVETLRSYYDILVRFEKPSQPRQPLLAGDIRIENPGRLPGALPLMR